MKNTTRTPARIRRGTALRLALAALAGSACLTARAVPSFARQIDEQCIQCHTEFPVLNEFGRTFKLSGYTLVGENGGSSLPPLAFMLQPSFTRTQADQAGGAAPGFGANNNFAVTQFSVFYAGRLFGPYADLVLGKEAAAVLDKFGIFDQTTYDGIGKQWHWDNTEVRFANAATVHDESLLYGLYANNNPGMQDVWNSTPAWGYPYSGSGLAGTPAASTLLEGGLSQQVVGGGLYMMYADSYYAELGAYHTLSSSLQSKLGIDPTGETQVSGLAPYWRLALDKLVGDAHWEVGMFGMVAKNYPGRDPSQGEDRISDYGFDTQYQVSSGKADITAMMSLIYENEAWNASYPLGNTAEGNNHLYSYKATVDYLYDKTYGCVAQYFQVNGGDDPVLYSGSQTGSPTSDGVILQFNYLPFNKNGGPAFWPRSNVKFSLQYVFYNRFNGAHSNYDGAGTNASANNTLYAEVWIVF